MTQSLQALLAHAESLRDDTQAELARAEAGLRQMTQQAEQLVLYRDEYRQRHPAQGGRSATIELLRVHQGFMQRLEQAIQQQQGQLQAAQVRTESTRRTLLAQETRVASVRKLIERRTQEAQLQAARRDQRRADDAAQRRRSPDEHRANAGWRLGVTEPAPLTH